MLQLKAYLIHHNDPDRQPQRQTIGLLLQQLGISLTAITDQPPLKPLHPDWLGRWRVVRGNQARLAADFAQRRLRQPKRRHELIAREVWVRFKHLLQLLCCRSSQLEIAWRQLQVEAIVSAKHAEAWRLALQDGANAALVFEDDVACDPVSQDRLRELLLALPNLLAQNNQLYCDLSGGYPLEYVVPLSSALPSLAPIEWLMPGVYTNTACAYLVSSSLLETWRLAEQSHPGLASLPIDHRINRVSAIAAADAMSGHWEKPPFRHGSFCGLARSWQL